MSLVGAFPKLLAVIEMGKDEESGLYKVMLELIFEMSRMHRLRNGDLCKCCGQSGFDRRNLMKKSSRNYGRLHHVLLYYD